MKKLAKSRLRKAHNKNKILIGGSYEVKNHRRITISALSVSFLLCGVFSLAHPNRNLSFTDSDLLSPVPSNSRVLFIANPVYASTQSAQVTINQEELTNVKTTQEPEKSDIEQFIYDTFGPEGYQDAMVVLKGDNTGYKLNGRVYCRRGENHDLNPRATNTNRNGSVDRGIFQINSIHGRGELDFDYKENITYAYKLYKGSGNTFKHWTCGKLVGDTTYLD